MKKLNLIWLGAIVLFIVSIVFLYVGKGFTVGDSYYNRPNPIMDYVPQYIGMYDTSYEEYSYQNCRECHGDRESVAKRHQLTGSAFADCPNGSPLSSPDCLTACHSNPADPQSITEDCLVCHTTDIPPHHNNDLSGSAQCNACHKPDLIVETRSVKSAAYYPTADTYTPTPFNCENCHWEAESPSDWPKKIYFGFETHHMGFKGNVVAQCYNCHSNDPGNPSWNPDNPLLIRYCENCHSVATLHSIGPHIMESDGWEAVGFHVPLSNDNITDITPTDYRTFGVNEKCTGCHGTVPLANITPFLKKLSPEPPAITDIDPHYGLVGTSCSITGEHFGKIGDILLTARMGETDQTYRISSKDCSWEDSVIQFAIPSGLSPGNYNLKVETKNGISNMRIFTLTGTPSALPCSITVPTVDSIEPLVIADTGLLTIHGQNFGDRHTSDRSVQVKEGLEWISLPIYSWTKNKIEVHIPSWTFPTGNKTVRVRSEQGISNYVVFLLRDYPSLQGVSYDTITHNLILSGTGGFGNSQQVIDSDGYGFESNVKLTRKVRLGIPDNTFTVKEEDIYSWSDTEIQITLSDIPSGIYGMIVETLYFYDSNSNNDYDPNDKVYKTVQSDTKMLELP